MDFSKLDNSIKKLHISFIGAVVAMAALMVFVVVVILNSQTENNKLIQQNDNFKKANQLLIEKSNDYQAKQIVYEKFADSCQKLIEKNNKINATKLEELVNKTNQELRLIAND